MQVFQNLMIECDEATSSRYIESMRSFLQQGGGGTWTCNSEAMAYYSNFIPSGYTNPLIARFHDVGCVLGLNGIAANVHLGFQNYLGGVEGRSGLYVQNIVPESGTSRLTIGQYNCILNNFTKEVVEPSLGRVRLEVTPGFKCVDEVFDQASARLFDDFARSANKYSVASHPSDAVMWFDFIISVVKNQRFCCPSADVVKAFLVEDYFWPSDVAFDLSVRYEFGIELLKRAYGI